MFWAAQKPLSGAVSKSSPQILDLFCLSVLQISKGIRSTIRQYSNFVNLEYKRCLACSVKKNSFLLLLLNWLRSSRFAICSFCNWLFVRNFQLLFCSDFSLCKIVPQIKLKVVAALFRDDYIW